MSSTASGIAEQIRAALGISDATCWLCGGTRSILRPHPPARTAFGTVHREPTLTACPACT